MKRKFLSKCKVVVACTMAATLLVGCGSTTASPDTTPGTSNESTSGEIEFKKEKVAFATNAVDETFVQMKNAFTDVIGPALNIEFMFSELLSDAGAFATFAENAYAAGCTGIISNLSQNNEQAAALSNDLGMYYIGIGSADVKENAELPYFISTTGASAEGYGESYANVLKSVLSAEEPKSVLVLSGAASYGATSFIEGTNGTLKALEEVYGLTYESDVSELVTTDVQVDAKNDKDIKITIFPGMADLATTVSPLLQSGEYDVVVGTTNIYDSLGVAIDEVEKALNKNIMFISRNTFSSAIEQAFNSEDSQGQPVMDGIVAAGTYENVAAAIIMRNALDGFVDNMRNDGKASRVPGMKPLTVTSADDYNKLSSSEMPYSYVTVEDILSLCNKVNPDVTFEDINEFGENITTESILAKFKK